MMVRSVALDGSRVDGSDMFGIERITSMDRRGVDVSPTVPRQIQGWIKV
jgi:hypothetical protein